MKKTIERDGEKWEMVCKACFDAAKAKHVKEEISAKAAKAANAAKATDKDKEKEKERSVPTNRPSKEKLLAEYSSSGVEGKWV